MQKTKILLINDIAGYGKVALSAMIPILSYKGLDVYNLPTAIVSNTLNYKKFIIQDTTKYLEDTLKVWGELGFSFDAVSTGFIVTERQMELIVEFCKANSKNGVKIFNDPIMGDNGRLYDGIPEKTVEYMKKLVSVCDITMPNYTEACLLTDTKIKQSISKSELNEIIDKLIDMGAKSVVVTSNTVDNQQMVAGFDSEISEYFYIPYNEIPVYFPGTGDIFSSVLIGEVMKNTPLTQAVKHSMYVVRRMIEENISQEDRFRGLPIERSMAILDEKMI